MNDTWQHEFGGSNNARVSVKAESTQEILIVKYIKELYKLQWLSDRQLSIYMGPGFRLRPNGIIQQENTSISLRNGIITKQGSAETLQSEILQVSIYSLSEGSLMFA